MKGQRYSLDSESRWQSIAAIAREIGIIVRPELCIFLEENLWSPALGYPPVRDLLSRTRDFTALFCFNDTSALGAIRAIQDAGLSCPHHISVIGFDDINVAEYFNPRLTTVRQPLYNMGAQPPQSSSSSVSTPPANPIPTTSASSPNSS